VRHLRVEFPTRRGTLLALDDISFDIAPGEMLGVVGESGAGKSLTGAAIIGLLEPPGASPAARSCSMAGASTTCRANRCASCAAADRRHLPGPADLAEPAVHRRPAAVETIRTHLPTERAQARERAIDRCWNTGIPAPRQRIDQYPHQFSAACASAW
jgi:peptide/nickel transport system ATP-binding protein